MVSGRTRGFYVVEGIDGAGKSSLVECVARRLREAGRAVTTTREPGGTELAERIRAIIKSGEADASGPPDAEVTLLLFEAARSENLSRVVTPALAEGRMVISDRFTASTRVYQGRCLGDADELGTLHALLRRPVPALTVLVDLPADVALGRLVAGRGERGGPAALASLCEKRRAYLALAAREGWVVVDGTLALAELAERVADVLGRDDGALDTRGAAGQRA